MKEKIALAVGFCERWEVCPQCKPRMEAILALIEQENAGMREALIEARAEIERLSVVTGYEGEGHFKVLAKIDAVLGGSHE